MSVCVCVIRQQELVDKHLACLRIENDNQKAMRIKIRLSSLIESLGTSKPRLETFILRCAVRG